DPGGQARAEVDRLVAGQVGAGDRPGGPARGRATAGFDFAHGGGFRVGELVSRREWAGAPLGADRHVDRAGPGGSDGFERFAERSFAGGVDEDLVRAEENA